MVFPILSMKPCCTLYLLTRDAASDQLAGDTHKYSCMGMRTTSLICPFPLEDY